MSSQAYAAGEAWRTGENQLTISSASRAFGYNADIMPAGSAAYLEALARYEAAILYLRNLGFDVNALPFGER
jgi:hypothetical protein